MDAKLYICATATGCLNTRPENNSPSPFSEFVSGPGTPTAPQFTGGSAEMSSRELPKRAAPMGPQRPVYCAATAELLGRYICALQAWDGPQENRSSCAIQEAVDGPVASIERAAAIRPLPVDFFEARNRFDQHISGLTASADLDHIHALAPNCTTPLMTTSGDR
ncbi:hypothetical protein ACFYT3_31375 [Nocardia amikacinitolerans]|uniref:hypothetical protein n=1 Tax=Nocardia amikacinitolerans TaxID=756689 RepID=UPI00369ABA0D